MTKGEKLQTEVITTEQAIYCMNHQYNYEKYECDYCPYCLLCEEKGIEGRMIKMAVKALETIRDLPSVAPRESCDDCVSRKAVINQIFYSTDNTGDVVLGSALRERIARLPSVTPQEPRWIPASERLPEDGEVVLGTNSNNDWFKTYTWDDCGEIKWYACGCFDVPVIAWMPLPGSYEGDKKDD